MNNKILYSNDNYHVVQFEEPILEVKEDILCWYGVICRRTDVCEINMAILPAAINTANNFDSTLKELLPDLKPVSNLTVVGDKDEDNSSEVH